MQLTMDVDSDTLRYVQKERLKKIRLYAAVTRDNKRVAGTWFEFDLPVDMSILVSPLPAVPEPISVFEQDGLYFELLDLQVDAYGNLLGDIRVENRSGMEKRFQQLAGAVNGVPVSCYIIDGSSTYYVLPEDSQSRFLIRFYMYEYVDGQRAKPHLFDPSEIQDIELLFKSEMGTAFALP